MQPESDRLTSLDGIRGLAIISVFLNHIDASFISFPSRLSFLSSFFFNSGVMGVSFLFILSGFLMAYIYPTASYKLAFLQKRYTRIFPLFLTMSLVSLIIFINPAINWHLKFLIIIILAIFIHFLWVNVIKKINNPRLSSLLFYSFLILQILTAVYYGFWIMRHPPIYLNQILPPSIRDITIGLVNSTLTLGFGNLVPMLDGVYWSLGSEVLFYILFPIICVPLIFYISKKSTKIKFLFVGSLFPLFAGIDVISHHILVMSIFQFQLFVYFVTGIALAYIYKNRVDIIEKITKPFTGRIGFLSLIFLILTIIIAHFVQNNLPKSFNSWFDILLALPLTYIVAMALNNKSYFYKFLSSKPLAFIGLISYSIYLSHTPILHILGNILHPINFITNLAIILITLSVTIAFSYFLFWMLEKPYFVKSKSQRAKINNENYEISIKKTNILFLSIIIFYLLITFGAFQSNFNFFSNQYNYKNPFTSTGNIGVISMNNISKIDFKITSTQNNLGVITMHINRHGAPPPKPQKDPQLFFRIKEDGMENWYSMSGYNLGEIGDSHQFPFGFPMISDSKGKTYQIELVQEKNPYEYVVIDTGNLELNSVYSVDKKDLIKNPIQFFKFIENRILTVLSNGEAKYSILMFMPFLTISLFMIFQEKLNYGKR